MELQLAVAQSDSATALAQLMRTGADASLIAEAKGQLASLAVLKRQLETAPPSALPALQAEIAACAAASSSFAKEASGARAEAGTHALSEAEARATARKTIGEVNQALFKDRIFDPYLQFVSKEDEDAYRKREAERQAAIEKELAKNTAQGELNALTLQQEQVLDAGAHGAKRSPDYAPLKTDIATALQNLEQVQPAKANPAEQSNTGSLTDLVDKADLAKFKQTGVVVADQHGAGHGVTAPLTVNRAPSLPG